MFKDNVCILTLGSKFQPSLAQSFSVEVSSMEGRFGVTRLGSEQHRIYFSLRNATS